MIKTSCNGFQRWLRASGVVLTGEKRQQCLAQELVGDNIVPEPAAMSFKFVSDIRATPFAYTPDIKANVFQI